MPGTFKNHGIQTKGILSVSPRETRQLVKQGVFLNSTITCPQCKFSMEERMPSNACHFFNECENCHIIIKPKKEIVVCIAVMEVLIVSLCRKSKIVAGKIFIKSN
jgi:preprotein translocase subunit Sec61beta